MFYFNNKPFDGLHDIHDYIFITYDVWIEIHRCKIYHTFSYELNSYQPCCEYETVQGFRTPDKAFMCAIERVEELVRTGQLKEIR